MGKEPLLKMTGISKSFLRIKANQGIDFEIYPAEVCALLGENGAGKSTLMKILFGLYRPDEGKIFIRGKENDISTPKDAIKLGIGMVHQHFNLVPNHQVWENIILGIERGAVLSKGEACRKIFDISKEFGLKVDHRLKFVKKHRIQSHSCCCRGASEVQFTDFLCQLTDGIDIGEDVKGY